MVPRPPMEVLMMRTQRNELMRRAVCVLLSAVMLLTMTVLPTANTIRAEAYQASDAGSAHAQAYANREKNWQIFKEALNDYAESQEARTDAEKAFDKDVENVGQQYFNYRMGGYMTTELQKFLIKKGLANPKAAMNAYLEAYEIAKQLKNLPKDSQLFKDLYNIGCGKYAAFKKYVASNKLVMTGAEKLVGGLFAAYSFYQMAVNPRVGYNSEYLELCANTVRGMSAASNVVLPGVGPLIYAGAEAVVCSENTINIVNDLEGRFRKTWIGDWTMWGLDGIAHGWNWLGQKSWEWSPGWMLYYDVPNWWQESEMAISLYQKKQEQNGKQENANVKEAKSVTAPANDVGVYKPNIYLYPAEATPFAVTFSRPELLTVTDPVYGSGWQGTALPDGTLETKDGTYRFLFYESLTNERYYQREAGFTVPAEDRAAVFTEILTGYGLNEQEIADFNEFWCEKLDAGCDYAMYPQLTETVDAAMPVTVTPAPDTVLRLWFAFVKDETPATTAVPQGFAREGTTMVEWGGFFLD